MQQTHPEYCVTFKALIGTLISDYIYLIKTWKLSVRPPPLFISFFDLHFSL